LRKEKLWLIFKIQKLKQAHAIEINNKFETLENMDNENTIANNINE
jgi:hypothetical protein